MIQNCGVVEAAEDRFIDRGCFGFFAKLLPEVKCPGEFGAVGAQHPIVFDSNYTHAGVLP